MTLMPDDEPEQLRHRRSFHLMGISCRRWLVLKARSVPPGLPAFLNSPRSRQTMASFLGIVAGMLGAASLSPAAGAACAVITLWP
jgi:hypothetical protein